MNMTMTERVRTPDRPSDVRSQVLTARGLFLGLALLLGLMASPVQAHMGPAITPPPPIDDAGGGGGWPSDGWAPPKAPWSLHECLQACFDQKLDNAARCKSTFCLVLLWIPVHCGTHYSQCLANVNFIFMQCVLDCDQQALAA